MYKGVHINFEDKKEIEIVNPISNYLNVLMNSIFSNLIIKLFSIGDNKRDILINGRYFFICDLVIGETILKNSLIQNEFNGFF